MKLIKSVSLSLFISFLICFNAQGVAANEAMKDDLEESEYESGVEPEENPVDTGEQENDKQNNLPNDENSDQEHREKNDNLDNVTNIKGNVDSENHSFNTGIDEENDEANQSHQISGEIEGKSEKDQSYKDGDKGPHVKELKLKLTELGFGNFPSDPSENYGPVTSGVVEDFQSYYGLDVTGNANEATLDKVEEILSSPFQKGKRHEDTIQLKKDLAKLGYKVSSSPTTLYGTKTASVVMDFQKDHNLIINGIADETTLAKIEERLSSRYHDGDKGPHVKELKLKLTELGFGNFPSDPSENYGPVTSGVVEDFQSYYGLDLTGNANKVTLDKVEEVLSSPFQKGKRHEDTIQLKKDLAKLGYKVSSSPTTLYGTKTTSVVMEFQKDHNLIVNGIADEVTLAKIEDGLRYRDGDKGPHVKELKLKLTELGFGNFPSDPSENYGPVTSGVVEDFQSYYGLDVTGNANEVTLDKVEEILSSPFQKGKRHEDTIQLKKDLAKLGYKVSSSPTNLYGTKTASVVMDFQKDHNLIVNGIADVVTLAKIEDGLRYRDGDKGPHVKELKLKLTELGFGNFPSDPSENYGPVTSGVVEDFQSYYGLDVTGNANEVTLDKVEEILSSPFQKGKRHEDTIQLKKDLAKIGYKVSSSPTTLYGTKTASVVKDFQEDYNLAVSGIADEVTLAKIDELVSKREHVTYTNYDVTFKQALDKQMNNSPQTDKYASDPAYVSSKYIDNITEHSSIESTGNVNLRTSPKFGDNVKKQAVNGDKVTILEEVKGDLHEGSTKWYKINYKNEKDTLYVHSSLVSTTSMTGTVNTNTLNVRAGTNTNSHIFGKLEKGTTVTIVKKGNNWHEIKYKGWRNPTQADLESYLDPSKNDRFQHLELSSTVNVSASELNKVLKGKGKLEGLGQAFINGGEKHKVNELYLISHALLETGNGTSDLAKGIEVGVNNKDNPVLVTSKNRKDLKNIKTVYNMFGIGAVDSDPKRLGAIRAYNEGWTTPKKAVEGGAKFIGERYIHSEHEQNTLYKMRWNPKNPTVHQYATDIGWAVKQINSIKSLYEMLDSPTLHFDIPVYK